MEKEYEETPDGWLPDWVSRLPDISMGAKITYSMLVAYGKNDGVAATRMGALARAIGSTELQAARFVQELQDAELIVADSSIGKGQGSRYYFVRPEER